MNNFYKNIITWIVTFFIIITAFNFMHGDGVNGRTERLAFSDFLHKVEDKQVNSVSIQGRNIEGKLVDGSGFSTYSADYPDLVEKLTANGVHIDAVPLDTKSNVLFSIFISWFPMLLLIAVWVFFMRQVQGGGKGLGLGKSKARMIKDTAKVMFKDVAGINEAKGELSEVVDFLRNPGKYQKLGGRIPKGCLLVGPPGTGKTLLAKAVAGEANVPFFSISGSDFVEMFVGIGASRVRDMFEQGKRNAPCIIFIDEIDAVGRHRGSGVGGGNDEREQTLNQMLVEMDGFDTTEGVIIIAATNRPDVLDSALLRPGRFDRQITVPNPDVVGREEILKVHAKRIKHVEGISLKDLARGTPGFSGAQLENLINEAALIAARANKKLVEISDLEEAKDKVMMGPERKNLGMSEEERKLTAYHEGGHALVALHSPDSDPIHKATILPRGLSLGMVQTLPEKEHSKTFGGYISHIAVAMGGRVAEEIIFGENNVTSGASQDIKVATNIAKYMVTDVGFSKKVGPVHYGSERSTMGERSDKMAEIIDSEIKRFLDEGYQCARKILTENLDELHKLAKALMEHETLSGKQIKHLLLGNDINDEREAVFPKIKGEKVKGKERKSVEQEEKNTRPLKASKSNKGDDTVSDKKVEKAKKTKGDSKNKDSKTEK